VTYETYTTKIDSEKGAGGMNISVELKQAQQQEPQHFQKRIGSTFYKVAIYTSNTSKEHIGDKILRLAKNDITKLATIPTDKRVMGQ